MDDYSFLTHQELFLAHLFNWKNPKTMQHKKPMLSGIANYKCWQLNVCLYQQKHP